MASNAAVVLDQFTRQAERFSGTAGVNDAAALGRIVSLAGATAADEVLDVACGPGIVAAAYARVARRVVGLDLTPAMLDEARRRQLDLNLQNVVWLRGDALRLPFGDGSFAVVNSRFALHHCPEPLAMLREMRRVCRPGGRVVVTDAAPAAHKAAAFNAAEKLRDPSHTRVLALVEHCELFRATGLPAPAYELYRMPGELEDLLARSFPAPGDAERLRAIYRDALADDRLDMAVCLEGGRLHYAFPVAILVATCPK